MLCDDKPDVDDDCELENDDIVVALLDEVLRDDGVSDIGAKDDNSDDNNLEPDVVVGDDDLVVLGDDTGLEDDDAVAVVNKYRLATGPPDNE